MAVIDTARVAELEAALTAERAAVAVLTAERDRLAAERDHLAVERDHLRLAYQNLQVELALLKKRLFDAKRERIDTAQLELELGAKLAALDALNRQLGLEPEDDADEGGAGKNGAGGHRRKTRPTGRRDLAALDLPVERIEIHDIRESPDRVTRPNAFGVLSRAVCEMTSATLPTDRRSATAVSTFARLCRHVHPTTCGDLQARR